MNKPHLFFRNPIEGTTTLKGRPGGGGKDDKEKDQEPKDYRKMATTFSDCIDNYESDYEERVEKRTGEVFKHFDVIELNFFAGFNEIKFKAYYIDNFGLEVLRLTHFNRKGLFAIEDKTKFSFFFEQLNIFISNQENATIRSYNPKIKFIKSFKLFSTDDRIGNINNYEVIHMSFMGVGSFLEKDIISQQKIDLAE